MKRTTRKTAERISAESDLLSEITRLCQQTGIAVATFGRLSVNDGKLVSRLRFGSTVRPQTARRIRHYMSEYDEAKIN